MSNPLRRFLSEELDRLSGRAQIGAPASASQLEQQQSAAGRLTWGHFIGRAEEMAALRTAIDASLGGQASLVMVAGEPGIGKTRLAEEAGAYARRRGAEVLVGRCYEGESASPYSPFVEVIREYISTRPDDALKTEMGDAHPTSQRWSLRSVSSFPTFPFTVCRSEW